MAANVEIVITGKDEFSGVMGGITSSLSDFGNIITGIQSAFELVGGALESVLTPVIEFGREAVLAAARVDELRVVNQILGENAGISGDAVRAAAEAVRSMGIEAGISESVVAAFIGANLDLAHASDIARIAQDAAVISGQNSSETLANIVYGIETLNPLVLRHAGIIVDLQLSYSEWADANDRTVDSLTTEEKQMIALNAVLEEGATIAGAYAAAMEEPGKVLRSIPRYIDDIMIALGEPFQEAFGTAVFAIADFLKELGAELGEGGALKPALDLFSAVLGDILNTALGIVGEINWDTIGASLRGIVEDIATQWNEVKVVINEIKTAFDEGGLSAAVSVVLEKIDSEKIVAWLDELDLAIAAGVESVDWASSGDAFGDALMDAITGNISSDTTAAPALGQAISDWFFGALGFSDFADSWGEFWAGIWESIDWGAIGIGFADMWSHLVLGLLNVVFPWFQIGVNIIEGILDGMSEIKGKWNAWATDNIINPIKQFLGIASPSTVFMGIGKDIVYGLIGGIASLAGWATDAIKGILAFILEPFKFILDALGIDTSSLFSTGSTPVDMSTWSQGEHDYIPGGTGTGTGTTTGGTGTGTGTVINQYFAGATINVGSWEEILYDCVDPNPWLVATGGQLGGGGGTGAPK